MWGDIVSYLSLFTNLEKEEPNIINDKTGEANNEKWRNQIILSESELLEYSDVISLGESLMKTNYFTGVNIVKRKSVHRAIYTSPSIYHSSSVQSYGIQYGVLNYEDESSAVTTNVQINGEMYTFEKFNSKTLKKEISLHSSIIHGIRGKNGVILCSKHRGEFHVLGKFDLCLIAFYAFPSTYENAKQIILERTKPVIQEV
jgi:hypothetical protein